MLYAIARELAAALKLQGVPFPVVFGPERTAPVTVGTGRIVLEHAGPGADAIGPARATHPNPAMPLVRVQGATIRIFARSNVAGAAWHDHAELAEQVLDHVLAELDAVVRGRRNQVTWGAGGFVEPADAVGSQTWGGAVYEIPIGIDRAVFRRTWKDEARPEATIGGAGVAIKSTTKVTGEAGTTSPETSCG